MGFFLKKETNFFAHIAMSQFGQHFFEKRLFLRRSFEAISVSIQNFAPFCRI